MKKILYFLTIFLLSISISNTYAVSPIIGSVNTPDYINSYNASTFPIFIKGIEDTDLNQTLTVKYSINGGTWSDVGTLSTPKTDTSLYFTLNLSSTPDGNVDLRFKINDGGVDSNTILVSKNKKTVGPLTPTSLSINGGNLFTNNSLLTLFVTHPSDSSVDKWCVLESNDSTKCNWVTLKPTSWTLGTSNVNSCNSTKPFCETFGGCSLVTGTPTTPNQSYVKGASNCGFSCNSGYSGDNCEMYTGLSCSSTLPTCVGGGTCNTLVFNPNSINQAWQHNTSSCSFVCNAGYNVSGTNCIPKTTTVNSALYNSRTFSFTSFTLAYGAPQSKTSNALAISNGTSTLTATFTLGTDGTTVTLSNQNESISCNAGYNVSGTNCVAKTTTVNSASYNSRIFTYTPFTLTYGSPISVLQSNALAISNGTSTLTATFTLGTDGTTVTLSNQNESISCSQGYMVSGSNCVLAEPQNVGDSMTLTFNIGGTNYDYSVKKMPDNKIWTTQNMRHPANSCNSQSFVNSSTSRWCGIYTGDSDNGLTYGWLYQFTAAIGNGTSRGITNSQETDNSVCSALGTGWRLPTDSDFNTLENSLGCTNSSDTGRRCDGLGWSSGTTNKKIGGLMSYLPGYRVTDGSYNHRGSYGLWWSSTQYDSSGSWIRSLYSSDSMVRRNYLSKASGFYVVCVKD